MTTPEGGGFNDYNKIMPLTKKELTVLLARKMGAPEKEAIR